jgi:hypothetical protein
VDQVMATSVRDYYTFQRRPSGRLYLAILNAGLRVDAELWVVVRPRNRLSERAEAVLTQLRNLGATHEELSSWPGTQLHGGTASIYRAPFKREVLRVAATHAGGLFDWQHPDLPEDPCLVRPDGSAWLTTIAHEEDAYLTLSEDEYNALGAHDPEVAAAVARDAAKPTQG